MSEPLFQWGDTARISGDAPAEARPGHTVAVVGRRQVQEDQTAPANGSTWMYIVEFDDGSSMEVPDTYLEPATAELPSED